MLPYAACVLMEEGAVPVSSESRANLRLLSGNEAIARGAFEAGVKVAAAYPGTPSTEILECLGANPSRQPRQNLR